MEDVMRCTGISTFPYCLKVLLNLWTRPMDLSCRGSTSTASGSASSFRTSCVWGVELDCGSSCGGWCFGWCAALLEAEVDSQRWPVGGGSDRRRTQQQNATGGSGTVTPTSNGRAAATLRRVPLLRMRCIIIIFSSSSSSSSLLWLLNTDCGIRQKKTLNKLKT